MADTARDKAQGIMDTAGERFGQAKQKVQEWAGDAQEGVSRFADRAGHYASEAYDTTGEALGDFGREMTSLIRRHPIPAVLVGFGIGLIMARVTRA
jgi:hypothetical protein